jgi:hypothetical protein
MLIGLISIREGVDLIQPKAVDLPTCGNHVIIVDNASM